MSAHTPGPWMTDGVNVFGPIDRRSHHQNGRTLIGGVVDDAIDWRGSPVSSSDDRGAFREERRANAALIAAAPDLLAALERLLNHDGDDPAEDLADIDAARAAIAKARGGA